MKILFYTPFPPAKETGACKVVIELAEEMELLGWQCDVIGPTEVAADLTVNQQALSLKEQLRQYLLKNGEKYDVVDYEHPHLPFARSDFSPKPIFVARSVMLRHHIKSYAVPVGKGLRAKIGQIVKSRKRHREQNQDIADSTYAIQQADMVNLCNDDEKETLMRLGVPAGKIIVLPFGISRSRRPLFDAVSSTVPVLPRIAFVGSFDYRKGANEFPIIVEQILAQVPDAHFRLLGTAGMFPTREAVLAHFPERLRSAIEVIPKYPAYDLPTLLESCSLGVFPSRIEGFPFGVLEMLAASLPVFAYDVPGPRATLPPEHLVKPGDAFGMSHKVIDLLCDKEKLAVARVWAKQRSQEFQWKEIASKNSDVYLSCIDQRKAEQAMLTR